MLSLEGVEVISLLSVWILEPRLPELLLELGKRGYAVARVRPKSLGGYDITFIEPNVAAIKGSTYVLYNPGRRIITIESPNANELLLVFNEVEEILRSVGSRPDKGVLFYELQVKAKATGSRWTLKKTIKVDDLIGLNLIAIPVSLVSVEGDPNSTRWFHLDIRPIWTSWSSENIRYEVVLICRDDREKLISMLKNIDHIIREIIRRASSTLEITT